VSPAPARLMSSLSAFAFAAPRPAG
jgi:hypothetical protein